MNAVNNVRSTIDIRGGYPPALHKWRRSLHNWSYGHAGIAMRPVSERDLMGTRAWPSILPAGRHVCRTCVARGAKGGAGGHNGLASINALIGTEEYARLRFGIGNDFARGRQSEYVLGQWTAQEENALPERMELAGKAILQFGLLGVTQAMNHFNKR